jgi:hypothetical protein
MHEGRRRFSRLPVEAVARWCADVTLGERRVVCERAARRRAARAARPGRELVRQGSSARAGFPWRGAARAPRASSGALRAGLRGSAC